MQAQASMPPRWDKVGIPRPATGAAAISTQEVLQCAVLLESGCTHHHTSCTYIVGSGSGCPPAACLKVGGLAACAPATPRCGEADGVAWVSRARYQALRPMMEGPYPHRREGWQAFWCGGLAQVRVSRCDWLV